VVCLSFFGVVRQFYCQRGVWTVACQRRSSEISVFVRSVLSIDVSETSKVGNTISDS